MNAVRVWVWVFFVRDDKILIWKRKWAHGEWRYGFPWGHLEFWEEVEDCAMREMNEETSLTSQEIPERMIFTNDIMREENKHYITIFVRIKEASWTPQVCEPDKCEEWIWLSWDEIKKLWDKNFLPIVEFIKQYPDFDPKK